MKEENIAICLDDLELPATVAVPIQDALPKQSPPSPLVLGKLQLLAESDQPPYTSSFVLRYLLLKIHSFKKYGKPSLSSFISHLTKFYNQYQGDPSKWVFRQSQSDEELMAQILLVSESHYFLDQWQLEEVLESSGLALATMVEIYFKVKPFLEKNEYAVTLSLVSLYARSLPFLSVVHTQKNHKGECTFAAAIFELMELDPNVRLSGLQVKKPELSMTQDAYSLRCTPHVHGVVYQCMTQIKEHLEKSLDKPLMRTIWVGKRQMRNLLFRSQTQTLMLDNLILALNQIGHMSFLRSERILNPHLTHNNISQSPLFDIFRVALAKVSHHVVKGKLLSAPSSADTVIMDNYRHDIYVNEGIIMGRLEKMLVGLTELMTLEVMESITVLDDVYGKGRVFKCEKMEDMHRALSSGKEEGYRAWSRKVKEWIQA